MKRALLLFLCLWLMLPVFSVYAEQTDSTESVESTEPAEKENPILQNLLGKLSGKPANEDQRLRQQIMRVHAMTLQNTEYDSLQGRCGFQVGWELYLLGIEKYALTNNGKDHYDFYKNAGYSGNGYPARAYDVQDYSLEEALNVISRNGTKNVYNILVGFEKTNTEAGQIYGHAIFIHAIYNGKVYCTEGYTTRFGTAEGEPVVITISQFAQWFSDWTEYEGLIYFGKGNALDSYVAYPCDFFAQSTQTQSITSQPDLEDPLRQVRPGERLHVTGMFEDLSGSFFYRVSDDGQTGFVPAAAFTPTHFKGDDVTLSDPVLPEAVQLGEKLQPKGRVTTQYTRLDKVWLEIFAPDGQSLVTVEVEKSAKKYDLGASQVRKLLNATSLEEGGYLFTVNAQIAHQYLLDGQVTEQTQTVILASQAFTVGQAEPARTLTIAPEAVFGPDGWNYIDGKWYFYQEGQPLTGWLRTENHDYYLDETGAAVTGWAEIGGKMRYFGDTGALRTGWLYTETGCYYLLRNGVIAQGWRMVEGNRYCFDLEGKLLCGGWTEMEGKLYHFGADGKAATGWVELNGVHYSFHADGHLLAKRTADDQLLPYDETWKP